METTKRSCICVARRESAVRSIASRFKLSIGTIHVAALCLAISHFPFSITITITATMSPRSHSRRKGAFSSSLGHAPVEFETVLRIRPLLKKERDDSIVLEKLPTPSLQSQSTPRKKQQQQHVCSYHAVALHPLPKKQDILSPSSALVLQTLSPDATSIQTCQDVEFQLDKCLSPDANQEKLYYTLGLPMALAVMESLKADPKSKPCTPTTTKTTSRNQNQTHLLIAMGLASAGKTFTCWGGASLTNRKAPSDGIVPRLIDSLYSQSLHTMKHKNAHTHFGVNISILQVTQSTKKTDDCHYHDLLLQPAVGSSTPSTFSRSSSVVRGFVSQSMSMDGSISSMPPPLSIRSNSSNGSRNGNGSRSRSRSRSSKYSSLDEPVSVEQDADSADFYTVNAQVRTCKTAEKAREALQAAFQYSRKLAGNSKHCQSHVLVKLQPVLLDRKGHIVQKGGTVAVLDMAPADVILSTSSDGANNKVRSTTKRAMKDAIPSSRNAHAAMFHCLRTLQHNQRVGISSGGTSNELAADTDSDADSLAYNDSHEKPTFGRQVSLKKVPYRQHKLTMLLQPLFSVKKTDRTVVKLLLAASPGHRDHAEKKTLLGDLEAFRSAPPVVRVTTGLHTGSSRQKDRVLRSDRKSKPTLPQQNHMAASDADDEGSVSKLPFRRSVPTEIRTNHRCPTVPSLMSPTVPTLIQSVPSMTYSDDEEEEFVPLPPPVAPSYSGNATGMHHLSSVYNNVLSPAASLPMEMIPSCSKPQVVVVDFPGVMLPGTPKDHASLIPLSQQPQRYSTKVSKVQSSPAPLPRAVSSAPPASQALPLQSASISNSTAGSGGSGSVKFSPMKTFNNVVTASKKKGKKVMDKMSVAMDPARGVNFHPAAPPESTPMDPTTIDVVDVDPNVLSRLRKLEAENAKLMRDNQKLQGVNQNLLQENQELRSKQIAPDRLAFSENRNSPPVSSFLQADGNESLSPSMSMSPSPPPKPKPALPAYNKYSRLDKNESLSSYSDDQGENRWSQGRQQQNTGSSMMDNPLFQHMAQLSAGQSSSSPWTTAAASSSASHVPNHFSLQVPSYFGQDGGMG